MIPSELSYTGIFNEMFLQLPCGMPVVTFRVFHVFGHTLVVPQLSPLPSETK
jgi:hypothetical protein